MGVERAVTRWYLHRHMLLQQIEQLQLLVNESSEEAVDPAASVDLASHPADEQPSPAAQLREARRQLHALGPCPRPVMG